MPSRRFDPYASPRAFAQRDFCAAAIRSRASGLRFRFLDFLFGGVPSPASAAVASASFGDGAFPDKACLICAICSSILERLSLRPSRAA